MQVGCLDGSVIAVPPVVIGAVVGAGIVVETLVEILERFVLGVGKVKAIKVRIHILNMDMATLMSTNSRRNGVDEKVF
jgi:hypothetical protein